MTTRRRLASMYASGELAALVRQHRTTRAVAAALGMERKALCSLMERMRAAGELPGWDALAHDSSPAHGIPNAGTDVPKLGNIGKPEKWPSVEAFDAEDPPLPAIPPGYTVRKLSTLVDGETGEIKQQWIKAAADATVDPVAVLRLAFPEHTPLCPTIEAPSRCDESLLAVYGMGDPHIGMLAWEAETGENFDLSIAEQNLFDAADRLVSVAPAAKTALVLSVGDTLHSDGLKNATTKGTPVDVDGRTPKMIATTIRTFKRIVYRSLEKHQDVHVKIARGNHDEMMSVVVLIALAEHFEGNPRVHVDTSPAYFHWFRFGANLITVTHGHRQKPMDIMGVMAATQPREWGETRHRRCYCGHYHHEMSKEVPGVIVDYLPTLAAKEAYAAAHGYIAERSMRCDVFDVNDGLIRRNLIGIDQLRKLPTRPMLTDYGKWAAENSP